MQPEQAKLAYLAADVGAIVWHVEGDRLVVDELAERLFGLRRGSFGSCLGDLLRRVRASSRDAMGLAMEDAVRGGLLDVEVVVDLPDGGTRTLQLRGSAFHDGEGNTQHVVAAVRDAGAIAEMRRELVGVRRDLAERDAELAETRARHDAVGQATANLLAHASRQIRTRLEAILGMSRIGDSSALEVIEANGRGLLDDVADLLDVALGHEASAAELEVTTIERLLAGVANCEIKSVPASIRLDAPRFQRALAHVIRGATRFATGKLAIVASSVAIGGTLHELVIEVRAPDTDLPADRMARLFSGGHGSDEVDLTLARRLLELLGGRLDAECTSRGTTVRIALPTDEAHAPPVPVALDAELATRHPLRVLVAEDNAVSRRITGAFLGKLGYTATFAADGREAVDAATITRFDLVLLDVDMPVMSGLEAARAIRHALPTERTPRLVALTANALPRDRAACLSAGCADFLAKPVTLDQLARVLVGTPRLAQPTTVLDISVLANLEAAVGAPVVAELIATYDADARELITTLVAAASRGDASQLQRAAHNLKSTSASLGALGLQSLCAELEHAGRTGDLTGVAPLATRASHTLADVRAALHDYLTRTPAD